MTRHVSLAWVLFPLILAFTGCSGGMTTVQGRLVMDGAPYRLAANEQVLLSFETIAQEPERSFSARVKPDGTFTVLGTRGDGIPPGSYRITIRSMPYGTTAEANAGDKFAGAFSGPDSPLTCEIKRGTPVTIDLGQKTVTGG